ncbi:hypothetical protein FRB95_002503 [Tulasnella sp. JGI-2019a]|nr:hypothetical protein FRB95_002503 [Tulasnella sp. JGI-2019a]
MAGPSNHNIQSCKLSDDTTLKNTIANQLSKATKTLDWKTAPTTHSLQPSMSKGKGKQVARNVSDEENNHNNTVTDDGAVTIKTESD